jgi:hypothetical protein
MAQAGMISQPRYRRSHRLLLTTKNFRKSPNAKLSTCSGPWSEQVTKSKSERNFSVAKLAIDSISSLVSTALAAHWDKLKTFFEHFGR